MSYWLMTWHFTLKVDLHVLHFHAITTQKLQAAKLHHVNSCCRVKLILSRVKLILPATGKTSSPLLYFWKLLLAILGGHWQCYPLQPITIGQCAWSLLSSANIKDLLQGHEWTTYSCCIHVVLCWIYPWNYVCAQAIESGKAHQVFGQLLCMSVSEHMTHKLINGPRNQMLHSM